MKPWLVWHCQPQISCLCNSQTKSFYTFWCFSSLKHYKCSQSALGQQYVVSTCQIPTCAKVCCSFANRGRRSCFEHFNLHDRGAIATCVVCFALSERHWEDLQFFAFSVWESQQCKCCYRVVNKHLRQYHFIYWKFQICLLVHSGPLFILASPSIMFEMKNICHRQREAGNSPVFESFYRNMEKQKLARSLRSPVTILPHLKVKRGKQILW